ncbi:D-ribose pyranase [Peribacillus simplex]|uniref:D-ribose pyranase n=1 Tax=Peribacillus TaxID=2675229 RepID=UPI00298D8722|nr:D-ribose pyranase [Peribacillus simplex]MDW7613673.1 D-ribose pyranase [Peribacillus simplex]
MKRQGIINSSIAKVLADLGHTDYIVVGDAGLPVPVGVCKIDLALTTGTPSFQDVVRAVHEDMVIEKVIAATEVKDKNPEQHQYMEQQFGDAIEYVSHEDFKTLLFLGSMVHLLALN